MTLKEKYEELKQKLISDYEKLAGDYVKHSRPYLDVSESSLRPAYILIYDAKSQMAQEYYVKSVNVSLDAFHISINEYRKTPNGRHVEELGNNSSTIIPLDRNLGGLWDIVNAMKVKMKIISYRENRFVEYENLTYNVERKMKLIMEHSRQKEITLELDPPLVFNMFFDEKKRSYRCLASKYIGVKSNGCVYYYWDKESMDNQNDTRRSQIYLNEFNLLPFIDLASILLKKIK